MDNRVVYVDGVAYSIARRQRQRLERCGLRLRPGHPGVDGEGQPARRRATRWRWARSTARSSPPAAGPLQARPPTRGSTTRRATRGRQAADAPVSLSASGQAVVDGKLYIVGGCTTSACTPMSNDVAAYDPATDTWEQLADYPAPVAFASCGGIDGKVYCTGGNGGAAGHGGQLRLRPGCRLVDADRRRPGRHLGERVHRGQRQARRQRRRPGRGHHQPHLRLRPRLPGRGPTCPTPTPPATAAGWRAASTRSVARPVASPRRSTARRCRASRSALPVRPTSSG